MADGDLSPHFSWWEFRCRCGDCTSHPFPAWELLAALEWLREDLDLPIHILSGCRCPSHNRRIGGTQQSRHLTRWGGDYRRPDAADILVPGLSVPAVYRAALKVPAFEGGGIGVYPVNGFVHVDTRHERARWAQFGRHMDYVAIPEDFGDGE